MRPSSPPAFNIRQATRSDARLIRRLLDENWAVHTRILPGHVQDKLNEYVAYLAEDHLSLRGFLMVEPQPPRSSLIVTVAVHDNSNILAVLKGLIPQAEIELRRRGVEAVIQIGQAVWLTQELPKFGFRVKDKIITLEWYKHPLPQIQPHPKLHIRSAQLADLPELLTLDRLAFRQMWHKPKTAFREALTRALSFAVGTIDETLVGYEWCDQFDDRVHLTRLAIHPDYQGIGIGTQLLHYTLRTVMSLNINVISLNTQKNNLRSRELYRRFGFKQMPEETGVYWKTLTEDIDRK